MFYMVLFLSQVHHLVHRMSTPPVPVDDSDSASGCSADMSNTDSGRGPSEDGDRTGTPTLENNIPTEGQYTQTLKVHSSLVSVGRIWLCFHIYILRLPFTSQYTQKRFCNITVVLVVVQQRKPLQLKYCLMHANFTVIFPII